MGVNVILLLTYTIIHKKKCVTDRKHENNKVAGLFLLCKFRGICIMKKLFFLKKIGKGVICKKKKNYIFSPLLTHPQTGITYMIM